MGISTKMAGEINDTEISTASTDHTDAKQPEDVFMVYALWQRLKTDITYRRRFVHSCWLFWAFVCMGWSSGQIGPSFPDLRMIANAELSVASWIISASSVGYCLGSLLGGHVYDKCNKLMFIVFSVLILAICFTILPWFSSFSVMIAIRVVSGFGAGGLATGGNADLVSMWDTEGRSYMQALHFCFGLGGILSPIVTEPFLAQRTCDPVQQENITDYRQGNNASMVVENAELVTSPPTCHEEYGETHIHYAFLTTGILLLSCAIPFFIMFLTTTKTTDNSKHMQINKNHQERPDHLSLILRIVLIVFLVFLMTTFNAVEDTFAAFLMTFLLQHMKWTKKQGSYATSLHWLSFSIGRFIGIFLIKKVKPVVMLFGYLLMLVIALVGFLAASITMTSHLVFVFVALTGFSISLVLPCIFTWTEESILEVTGVVSSMFLVAGSTGLLLNPVLTAYLMGRYEPIAFAYLLLAESCLCLIIFLVIFILVKQFVKFPAHRLVQPQLTYDSAEPSRNCESRDQHNE